jgi:hypothetical protein
MQPRGLVVACSLLSSVITSASRTRLLSPQDGGINVTISNTRPPMYSVVKNCLKQRRPAFITARYSKVGKCKAPSPPSGLFPAGG